MAKKKGTLSGNYENEFSIIGIACHEKYYRIAHYLNKILNFNFTCYDDIMVFQKKIENSLGFPFYYFNDIENLTSFHLIGNRSTDGILISDWKQIDYLLIILGSVNNINLKSMINQIKKIPNVLAASEMITLNKPDIENLMTDLELHLIEISKKEKEKDKEVMNKLKSNRFSILSKKQLT
jgi:hypothetical protein